MQAPRWEYQTITLDFGGILRPKVKTDEVAQQLNQLGELGWELVSTCDLNASEGRTSGMIAIFKRPRN